MQLLLKHRQYVPVSQDDGKLLTSPRSTYWSAILYHIGTSSSLPTPRNTLTATLEPGRLSPTIKSNLLDGTLLVWYHTAAPPLRYVQAIASIVSSHTPQTRRIHQRDWHSQGCLLIRRACGEAAERVHQELGYEKYRWQRQILRPVQDHLIGTLRR